MSNSALKRALPSVVSSASLVVALASVALASAGEFAWAAWLIVYCTLLDKVDGAVARALGVSSAFGVEMDSFADITAFGIAPAALMWFVGLDAGLPAAWVGFAAAACPVVAAVRLAHYNVSAHEDHDFFTGVPTTFAAGLFAAAILSLQDLGLLTATAHGTSLPWATASLPPLLLGLSVLMVSRIRLPKIKKRASGFLNVLQVGGVLLGLVLSVLQLLPEVILGIGVAYLVIAPIASAGSDPARTDG